MNVNHFDPKKTGLLFFDILNGYVPAPEPGADVPSSARTSWLQCLFRLLGPGGRRRTQLPLAHPRSDVPSERAHRIGNC